MQRLLSSKNQTKQLLHSIMEYCDDIITFKDSNLNYIACNKAFLKFIKISTEAEIIGKNIHEVLPDTNAQIIESYAKQVFKSLKNTSHTVKFVCDDNNLKHFKQTLIPVVDNGNVLGIVSVYKDITNNENLQSELLKKMSQLDTLLEYLPLHVYLKDLDKNFVIGSKYAKNFTKYGCDFLADNLNLDLSSLSILSNKEDDYVIQFKEVLEKENTVFDYSNCPHTYKTKKVPILDTAKNVIGLITMIKNIDKEKQMESQKDLFVATLTHDLKNPILAQISSLRLFNEGYFGDLKKEQKDMIETMLESSNHMKKLLYSIIRTYKENNGSIQLVKSTFCIKDLIETNIREVTNLARERGLSILLTSDLNDEQTQVTADKTQIRRVVDNLLNNAIKYAFDNTKINIHITKEKENIVCSIRNNSLPISQQLRKHIFEKYVCTTEFSGVTGTGLGLYYCKKIIEGHNGMIEYLNDGNFNIFEFKIPREKAIVECKSVVVL